MSRKQKFAVAAAALAASVLVVMRLSQDSAEPARLTTPAAAADQLAAAAVSSRATTQGTAATPALPGSPPFREQDLVVTTDMPEGPLVALRSSALVGRDLRIELGAREPVAEGKRLFAIVSVSDGLGNTVMDCTWRDVELTDDPRELECELPADVTLPLTISGHQLSGPSFVEAPVVVAIDQGVHP